ncbi:phytoene desaturase family protein [Pusillimonas noertemannii]|uniref:phytoene desaturase family protein n=1 Tax=Pusillimonas noertemannii TaxID=305977 RepID=UPI0002E1099E|nr:NAD(P)/FAD-dependent oxidoreductase [Pusillimonas noertemannii]
MNKTEAQIIVVGSGMNSLVCAALLAKRGKSVLVLERNDRAGGCIRTEELFPGFQHEVLSSWYPLFMGGAAYPELKDDLAGLGVEFVSNGYTTGVALPDGRTLALRQDIDDAVRRIEAVAPGDGQAFGAMAGQLFGKDAALTFGLLGNSPYDWKTGRLLFSEWRKRGNDGLLGFAAESLESFRRWGQRTLSSDLSRAMISPWVLHTGLGPDDATSALIGKLTFAAVVAGGMPVVKGGSQKLVQAMQALIERNGGQVLTGVDVTEVIISGDRATGVKAGGTTYTASQAVVCNVTPPQLYGRLLPQAPEAVRGRAQAYAFGRGCMQIHFALNGPAPWRDPEMLKVPLVHLADSMESVCMSVTEANNGLLPRTPTVAIGQPVAVDPSRAPEGKWILWLQLQEMPSRLKGDAAGQIEVPPDGQWNDAVREAMADRVQARLETVLPGLSGLVIGRRAYSPGDLQAMNCNLVGGDPYSGICSPDQFFWLRPFAGANGAKAHKTPYKNVFHIGASTHPGPGLGGGSGYLVAQALTRK